MSRGEIVVTADLVASKIEDLSDSEMSAAQLVARAALLGIAGIECEAARRDARFALIANVSSIGKVCEAVLDALSLESIRAVEACKPEVRPDGTITGPLTGTGTMRKQRGLSVAPVLESSANDIDASSPDVVESE